MATTQPVKEGIAAVLTSRARRGRPLTEYEKRLAGLVYGFVPLLLVAYVSSVLFGLSTPVAVVSCAMGGALIRVGWIDRTGDGAYCKQCEYSVGPHEPVSDRCPECGAEWLKKGGMVRGTRRRNPALGWVGLALIGLALAWLLLPRTGLITRHAPLHIAISRIASPNTYVSDDEWQVLTDRVTAAGEEVQLIQALIDRRNARSLLMQAEQQWLDTAVTASGVPLELVKRYHRNVTDIRLRQRSKVASGELVQIDVEYRPIVWISVSNYAETWLRTVFVNGVEIDGFQCIALHTNYHSMVARENTTMTHRVAVPMPSDINESVVIMFEILHLGAAAPPAGQSFPLRDRPIDPVAAGFTHIERVLITETLQIE